MATITRDSLFSWEIVSRSSQILLLKRIVETLPDEALMATLEAERKERRDDYPLRAIWNSLLAGVLFGHGTVASLIRELRRNAELREVCGFDVVKGEEAVPPDYVYTRFLKKLLRHCDKIEAMFDGLVERLTQLLPDYGKDLAIDTKALRTWSRKDAQADSGTKTYEGVREDGTLYERVVTWLGYKLHLVIDANWELPVAWQLTEASVADSPQLLPMMRELNRKHAELIERTETLAADKAYDDGADKAELYDEYGIAPLIDTRDLYHETSGKMKPLDPQRHDTIYYSGTGEVFCKTDPFAQDDTKRFTRMNFMGFEQDRRALKFRCPAAAYGIECKNREACRSASTLHNSAWGRVVRVPLDVDRRLFLPIHRDSYTFERLYRKRTAIERVNSRLDNVYGFERHFIAGKEKMTVRVGLALVVMLATAVACIEAGHAERARSLLRAA